MFQETISKINQFELLSYFISRDRSREFKRRFCKINNTIATPFYFWWCYKICNAIATPNNWYKYSSNLLINFTYYPTLCFPCLDFFFEFSSLSFTYAFTRPILAMNMYLLVFLVSLSIFVIEGWILTYLNQILNL